MTNPEPRYIMLARDYVLAISLAGMTLGAVGLFLHYVFPGEDPESHRTLHFVVLVAQPVFGFTSFFILFSLKQARGFPKRVRMGAWSIFLTSFLVGLPLWLLSFVV